MHMEENDSSEELNSDYMDSDDDLRFSKEPFGEGFIGVGDMGVGVKGRTKKKIVVSELSVGNDSRENLDHLDNANERYAHIPVIPVVPKKDKFLPTQNSDNSNEIVKIDDSRSEMTSNNQEHSEKLKESKDVVPELKELATVKSKVQNLSIPSMG